MKYIGPRDNPATVAEPYPPFVNGDRQAGIKGSIPDGKVFEHLQREIEYVITQAGLTPDEATLTQLHQAITAIAGGGGGGLASVVHDATMTGTGVDEATKLSVIQATDALRGAVELATSAEAQALADAARVITPATLLAVLTNLRLNNGLPANAAGFLSNNGAGVLSWIKGGVPYGFAGANQGGGASIVWTMANSNVGIVYAEKVGSLGSTAPTVNGTSLSGWTAGASNLQLYVTVANGRVYARYGYIAAAGFLVTPSTDHWVDVGAFNGTTVTYSNGGQSANDLSTSHYLNSL